MYLSEASRLSEQTVERLTHSGVTLERQHHKPEKEMEETVEQEIQRKGLTAPRVTPADIEAAIASEHYFTAYDGAYANQPSSFKAGSRPEALNLLTFCVLVLRNGFTVTGESACASPENFDAELGRKFARQNAVAKMWPLLGYALKDVLYKYEQSGGPEEVEVASES